MLNAKVISSMVTENVVNQSLIKYLLSLAKVLPLFEAHTVWSKTEQHKLRGNPVEVLYKSGLTGFRFH